MADNTSALRTSRDAPSLFEQVRTASQLTPQARYEMTDAASDTQFSRGLRSGAAGLSAGSFANQALSQEAAGEADWQRSRDLALKTQQDAAVYAPRVSSLRDIHNLSDAGDYAAGTIGQGVMSMAPTLAVATLTRGRGRIGAGASYLGAAGTAYNLERGEAALGQYSDPTLAATNVSDRDFAATTKGAINAGLESLVPAGIARTALRKPAASTLGNTIAKNALEEGLTETAQQAVGFGAEKYLDPNRELDPAQLADAFASGLLTGGGVSAVSDGVTAALPDPRQNAEPVAPPVAGSVSEPSPTVEDTTPEEHSPLKDFVAGTVDKMTAAAQSATSSSDFLRSVFGRGVEDTAATDAGPDEADPNVVNAADPVAALQERDAQRQARAAQYAAQLLQSDKTSDSVKARIASLNGDFSNPDDQLFVSSTLAAQQAAERVSNIVTQLTDLAKNFANKSDSDRVSKMNLQDASPAEQASFNKLIFDNLTEEARANPEIRQRLPDIANAMLAFAARTGDLTAKDMKVVSRVQEGLSLFENPDAVAEQLTQYAGLPRPEDSFLSRIKRVSNAQQDIKQPNSFLYSSLTDEARRSLTAPQLRRLAQFVDEFSMTDSAKDRGDAVLAGLSAAFGSTDAAKAVLDYYQQQNHADTTFDSADTENLTEHESAPQSTYQFANAKAMRPFRSFVGQMTNTGGMRQRLRESTIAAAQLRSATPDGANVKPVKMSQYVADTKGDAEAEVKRIAADIKDRIAQHKARKNEDRTQQINELEGELELMRQKYKQGGANAALDLYEVLQTSEREQNDTIAEDKDVAKMSTLAEVPEAKDTRVTFQRTDGSTFTLSAESMWKTQGDKEGPGKGESAKARAKRLFADAAASVLARPEVAKMVTSPEKITIDRKLQLQAKNKPNPEYRKMVAAALKNAEGSIRALKDRLESVMDEYMDGGDAEASSPTGEFDSRREEIENVLAQNIEQLTKRLDDARGGNGPLAENMAAQAVAREKLRLYREAQTQIEGVKFDEAFEERDNNRSGVPGSDGTGPIGPNQLNRTRMNEELADPGTRYTEEDTGLGVGAEKRASAMNQGTSKTKFTAADRQKIIDEIARIRGKDVKVAFTTFAKLGGSGEFSMNADKTGRLIQIAVNAANPMGTAWHESLHDFFAMLDEVPEARRVKKDLIDAAESPFVKKQLNDLLAQHPAAMEQVAKDPEERVAYMYQFWAEGLLRLGPTGTGIFERVRQFFREMLGIIGVSDRAGDLLTALHDGKFADPNTVSEVLADLPADRLNNKIEKFAPEVTGLLQKLFTAAPDRLRAFQNDKLNTLADMFSSETGKLGFIQKRFQQQGVWENKLAGVLKGSTSAERRAALENLQSMKSPSSALEQNLADFFREMHDYMLQAGVKTQDPKTGNWTPIRQVKNYFPRAFDRQKILSDKAKFTALLQLHGQMSPKQAEAIVNTLTHGTGQMELAENEHALGYSPFAKAVEHRQLTFINPSNAADFAKYQVKDLADITTGYVKQAVHRAEYARMFGNDGEVISQLINQSGVTDKKELKSISNTIQGLEGSLGSEMSTQTKELMSAVMTLQNLVVLPLSIFSQVIDPLVLAARSGELRDAGNAYTTALKRLVGKKVDGEDMAEMLGIISQDTVLEAMGAAYGNAHMSKRMRDINRVFFKYNGMQGWNNSMRIAATVAGEKYLLANKSNTKALDELGLTPADIKTMPDGRLDVSSPEIQQAMYRFVDQAVLRPSASNRPVWMSDPRFLLVAHLKQFTYAMHNVVLKRATKQLDEGNPKPWATLMLMAPVILAADMAKFALTGNMPTSWGFKDYLVHAVERSGLLGLGDFGVQSTRGVEQGRLPGESLLGPTFENLMTLLRWLMGDARTGAGDVAKRTIPGARFI